METYKKQKKSLSNACFSSATMLA